MRRVRFAPSPTGPLHVGGLRTALFNYLFAKNSGGDFILRIEDTDKKREVAGAEQYIVDALAWCGITTDEGPKKGGELGPYRQSERNHFYEEKIKILIDSGYAYYAFDSEEELSLCRENSEKKGERPLCIIGKTESLSKILFRLIKNLWKSYLKKEKSV